MTVRKVVSLARHTAHTLVRAQAKHMKPYKRYKFETGARVRARKPEQRLVVRGQVVVLQAKDVIGTIKARLRPYEEWSMHPVGPGVRGDLPVYEVVFDPAENPGCGIAPGRYKWRCDFTEDQLEAVPDTASR